MEAADSDSLEGWIVDLRGNRGGNMWPMLAALSPFLQGRAGFFVEPGDVWLGWGAERAAIMLERDTVAFVNDPYGPWTDTPRIAVLTDRLVATAGEAVAVAFRGHPRARSFGTATCGQSTAVFTFVLADGGTLGLVTARLADRDSVLYGGPLVPDEIVLGTDAVVSRAIAWLRTGL
jgi:C-terminal processing protease CtpA/Prc